MSAATVAQQVIIGSSFQDPGPECSELSWYLLHEFNKACIVQFQILTTVPIIIAHTGRSILTVFHHWDLSLQFYITLLGQLVAFVYALSNCKLYFLSRFKV